MRRTEKFICPCDNKIKYVLWNFGNGAYKYSKWHRSDIVEDNVNPVNGHFIGTNLERDGKPVRSASGQIIKIYTVDYFNNKVEN